MKLTCLVATLAMMASWAALAGPKATAAAGSALTVYNAGPAVVWQTRELSLEKGVQTITWPIAAQIVPGSLWLAGDGTALVGATIFGARPGPDALLSRRIGKPVALLPPGGGKTGQATLVSVAGNHAVVRIGDRLELVNMDGGLRIAWPASQKSSAGLKLTVRTQHAGKQPLTLAYQRAGVNWHASYTGRFDPSGNTLTLQSLAVIENGGNAGLQADRVALVAGAVARVHAPRPQVMMMARSASAKAAPEPERAGAYYRYELGQPLDVPAGATQVLALMPAQALQVQREYRIEGAWYRGTSTQRDHASVRLTFRNATGKPLPSGPVRVYGQTRAMLLGEDHIGNIPEGAPVTLTLGRAFDITAERRVTHSSQDGDNHGQTMAVTVYNALDDDVDVHLVEHLPNGAKIVSESAEHASKTAREAAWKLAVPAHGKVELTYTVRWVQ